MDKMERAVERRTFSAIYRVVFYAVGAVAVGGAGIGASAHTRISNEHDTTLLNTQAISALQDALNRDREDRKEESRRVNEKLDRLLEMILDSEQSPSRLGKGRP